MSLAEKYPFYLANEAQAPNVDLEVSDKYTAKVATRVAIASPDAIDRAIAVAVKATLPMRKLPPYQRQTILQYCVERFRERFDELAMALCIEAGKPIRDSRGEVPRLIDTTFKSCPSRMICTGRRYQEPGQPAHKTEERRLAQRPLDGRLLAEGVRQRPQQELATVPVDADRQEHGQRKQQHRGQALCEIGNARTQPQQGQSDWPADKQTTKDGPSTGQ